MDNSIFTSLLRLLQAFITGFGLVIPLVCLIRSATLKNIAFKEAFILTAVQVVRILGIVNFLANGIYVLQHSQAMGKDKAAFILSELMPALLCLVITQCFWIKKLYHKKAALISLSLLLLVMPSKWLLAYAVSTDKKFLPDLTGVKNILLTGALGAVVFFFLIFMIMNLSGRLKKLQQL